MLPIIREPAFYPGQLGVAGSDVESGLRWRGAGIVLYVNNVHPGRSDSNDGTNPNAPLITIGQAFTNLAALQTRYLAVGSLAGVNSYIIVEPGTYTESLTIATTTMPDYGVLMGGGNGRYPVIWDDATTDCLTITAYGWRVANFHFRPANAYAGVKLSRPAGSGAEGTVIENCFFDGQWSGTGYGVALDGAPANCTIQNCRFAEFATGGGAGITVTDTSIADPYQTHVIGCTFQEANECITRDCAGGWNQSVIWNNVFIDGTVDAAFPTVNGTDTFIDMRGGSNGYNKVCGNHLGGVYSEVGGYYDGTADEWWGNYANVATILTLAAPA